MTNIVNKFFYIFVLLLFSYYAFADVTQKFTKEDKKTPELPNLEALKLERKWNMTSYNLPWIVFDSNKDGVPDSAVRLRNEGYKKYIEVLDTNFDGKVDDFAYFNLEGEMVFQEIDSDYDGKIDWWITIIDGTYMKRFQRDKDFDGYIDIDRTFE